MTMSEAHGRILSERDAVALWGAPAVGRRGVRHVVLRSETGDLETDVWCEHGASIFTSSCQRCAEISAGDTSLVLEVPRQLLEREVGWLERFIWWLSERRFVRWLAGRIS